VLQYKRAANVNPRREFYHCASFITTTSFSSSSDGDVAASASLRQLFIDPGSFSFFSSSLDGHAERASLSLVKKVEMPEKLAGSIKSRRS